MPKHCLKCGYATPDEWADECPFCLVPLARVRPSGRRPMAKLGVHFPRKLLLPLGLFVGVVVLAFAVGASVLVTDEIALGPAQQADSTGRVRVGMTAESVARVLGMEQPTKWNSDDPDPHFSGRFVWQKQGRLLRIHFRDGRVTGVEEGPAGAWPAGTVREEIHYDD